MADKIYSRLPSLGFWRLLIKYISIVLILLTVLAPFISAFMRHRYMSAQVDRIQESLDAAQDQVNYSLKTVDNICVSIDKSDIIVFSLLGVNAYSRLSVCKLLNAYSVLDTLYRDLGLFSTETPTLIYTHNGTDLVTSLNEFNCFEPGVSPSVQLGLMQQRHLYSNRVATDDSPLTCQQLTTGHSWLYICPASVFSSSVMTIFLRINTLTLYSLYNDVLAQYNPSDYCMITVDSSNRIIGMTGALYTNDEIISPSWLQEQLTMPAIITLETQHSNFTNYFLLDSSMLSSDVANQMKLVWSIYAAFALLALGICSFMAWQIYRPVALLHNNIMTSISGLSIDKTELRNIDNAIANIIRTYNNRNDQSRHILELIKQQLIYWALLGNLPRTSYTDQLQKMTGFDQPNMLFCVLAIHMPPAPEQALIDNLCNDIQNTEWNHSNVIATYVPSHNTLAVVFHMFVELDTRARQEYAANTLRFVLDQYSITSSIGVGISQPTLFTLSRSYSTARQALNEASDSYCLFEDIGLEESDRFSSCLQTLIEHINHGNIEEACSTLTDCLRLLDERKSNQAMFYYYKARLLNEVTRQLVEMNIWDSSKLESEIERLMFMNQDELTSTLNALLYQLSVNNTATSEDDKTGKWSILSNVHDYLAENALDPMLNINLEAEKYGLSSVTLNRWFRMQYGVTMVAFVSDLRMEKAKELLRDSEMLIKEIVTAVGYYDVPNFSRKFKASVGVTPGQYRQQMRGENDEDTI
ncbi:MAG: helix-turn-helix transcriptional regulator [Clostridia bacterium]|nr:helix-turn-helix transcriptional regulator [Clostridia bacterium]